MQAAVRSVRLLLALRREVLPAVDRELAAWRREAEAIDDPAVRDVALDSLDAKRFHCEGGSALALCAPAGAARARVVRAIVAVQTLSDFLDSLTDRRPDGTAWAQGDVTAAHAPFVAAVTGRTLSVRPGDAALAYATTLAEVAARELGALPGMARARPRLHAMALRYVAMQAMKHGPAQARERDLRDWHARAARAGGYARRMAWPAHGAAAGSTLAMFRLYAWAAEPADAAAHVERRYAPWTCALHIVLDAVIDQAEDRASGDLNWAAALAPAGDARGVAAAVASLAGEARRALRGDALAALLVPGLFATYLVDAKARDLDLSLRAALWRAGGPVAWALGAWLWLLRRGGRVGPRTPQRATGVPGPRPEPGAPDADRRGGGGGAPQPAPVRP